MGIIMVLSGRISQVKGIMLGFKLYDDGFANSFRSF